MWLEVLDGPGAGDRVAVGDEPVVLGRERGCDVVVRDARASRRHAEVRLDADGTVAVQDLRSANGTWAGTERVSHAVLGDGEVLRVGGTRIAVRREAPAPETAPPALPSAVGALLERSARRAGRATTLAAAAVTAAMVAVAALALGAGDEDPVPEVVAAAGGSVVRVEAWRTGARTATASGWVLDADEGLVVTNAHVVNEGERFTAQPGGGRARTAAVVGVAPCEDLAVLRVPGRDLRALPLGDQDTLRAGQAVVALGFPGGGSLTSTTGVVSVPRTALDDPAPDVPVLRDAVQTDTDISPGSSGGPLVDLDSRLVGVTSVARTQTAGGRAVDGMGFALGVDRVRDVVARLRAGRSTGWTGLTFGYPSGDELARRGLPRGVYITGAVRGTPASRLGLTGGLLLAVDGRPVGSTLATACAALAGADGRRSVALSVVPAGGDAAQPQVVRVPLA